MMKVFLLSALGPAMTFFAFGWAILGLVTGFAPLVKCVFCRGNVSGDAMTAAAGNRGCLCRGLMMAGLTCGHSPLVGRMVKTDFTHGGWQFYRFGSLVDRRHHQRRRKHQASNNQQYTHLSHLILLQDSLAAHSA